MEGKEIPEEEIIEEDSPEWEELNRQADAEKAEFKRIVLANPLEALKPATFGEVWEGIRVVNDELQRDHSIPPSEKQKRIQDLAQGIIDYKTGKQLPENQESWSPSMGLFLRETLVMHGLVPQGYRPSKREQLRARIGDYAHFLKETIVSIPKETVRAASSGTKQNPEKPNN